MHRAGGRVLAIEAGKSIVLALDKVIALANHYSMAIVAVQRAAPRAA
jgi:DUF1009 family protein